MRNSPEKLPRHPSAGWDLRPLPRHPSEGWDLPSPGRAVLAKTPAFAGVTKMGEGVTKGGMGLTKLGLIAAIALPLAACTPNDPTLGAAVKHNYAMQVIDPDPEYAGVPNEGGSGDKAKGAQERYRTDKVKQPKTIRTTSGIGGGGSGSGGSSK